MSVKRKVTVPLGNSATAIASDQTAPVPATDTLLRSALFVEEIRLTVSQAPMVSDISSSGSTLRVQLRTL